MLLAQRVYNVMHMNGTTFHNLRIAIMKQIIKWTTLRLVHCAHIINWNINYNNLLNQIKKSSRRSSRPFNREVDFRSGRPFGMSQNLRIVPEIIQILKSSKYKRKFCVFDFFGLVGKMIDRRLNYLHVFLIKLYNAMPKMNSRIHPIFLIEVSIFPLSFLRRYWENGVENS